jgi:asparagine synthase (glutamine-hydrolysing)
VSGFVGLLNLDGAPVDGQLLSKMTQSLAFRGPDTQHTWHARNVGFGHTLLKTSQGSSDNPQQPFSLDGNVWIVADARIDAQRELVAALHAKGSPVKLGASDAELILHSYQAWGADCVEHLLGDFAFAIWDAPQQTFLCARDHFGVRPFFYALAGQAFLFSNTLECLLLHSSVSAKLNDLAIADFLLFDSPQDQDATVYTDTKRLPPAHALVVKDGRIAIRRYWTLPAVELARPARPDDSVEQFKHLMHDAVVDRVRAGPVGVYMSGGLDSTTVAAFAQQALARTGHPNGVRAYAEVYDRLIPHDERKYAGLAADGMGIPIYFHPADDYEIFHEPLWMKHRWPEPMNTSWTASDLDLFGKIANENRLVVTGFGGDPALSCRLTVHFAQLLKAGHLARVPEDAWRYLTRPNRISRLYLRARWRVLVGRNKPRWFYPSWINPDLEKRFQLRARHAGGFAVHAPPKTPPERITGYQGLELKLWPDGFESMDAGATGLPLEFSHPFFDLRLLSFALSLPAMPWCSDKELLREATRGLLPDAVRHRRKTTLQRGPVDACLQHRKSAWVDTFEPAPGLAEFVVRDRIPPLMGEKNAGATRINLRPLCLNFWLQGKTGLCYKNERGAAT